MKKDNLNFKKILKNNHYDWADLIIFCIEEDGYLFTTLKRMWEWGDLDGIETEDQLYELFDYVIKEFRRSV